MTEYNLSDCLYYLICSTQQKYFRIDGHIYRIWIDGLDTNLWERNESIGILKKTKKYIKEKEEFNEKKMENSKIDKTFKIEKRKIIHHCEVSDSWVHPINKLSNGKSGNGEARLFISCGKEYHKKLCEKPWKIVFHDNYVNDVESFMSNDNNFIKMIDNRMDIMRNNIKNISGEIIIVKPQNGGKDIRRHYVGVKHIDDIKNKDKWNLFRKCVAPTLTTLEFYDDNEEYFTVRVVHNKNIKKYNIPHGCSFISLEWLKYMENKENIEIQTAMNGGEHKERKDNGYFSPVDGYHNCEKHKCCGTKENPCKWNQTVFEFQGDYWHKNKHTKDIEKKKKYEEFGYKVIVIWEREFMKIKKTMNNEE